MNEKFAFRILGAIVMGILLIVFTISVAMGKREFDTYDITNYFIFAFLIGSIIEIKILSRSVDIMEVINHVDRKYNWYVFSSLILHVVAHFVTISLDIYYLISVVLSLVLIIQNRRWKDILER